MQFQGLYYHMVQIVVIQRDCNGLHGGFQFVLGQVTLPNDEHLSDHDHLTATSLYTYSGRIISSSFAFSRNITSYTGI